MNNTQKINIMIETGEKLEAEVLAIVEIDEKDYCIYTITRKDGNSDILASYVVKDKDGYDDLKDINDPKDREKVAEFIKSMINA